MLPGMKKKVVAFGEVLWDLLPSGPQLGGAPCNFAYRINSLGDEGLIVSRVGDDERGHEAARLLAGLGMSTTHLQWDKSLPTGTVDVTLDEQGSPDFHIVPGVAYDELALDDDLVDLAETADCVCYGTLLQRADTARASLYQFLDDAPTAIRLLDVNLRKDCHTPDTIRESLRRASIAKVSDSEADYLNQLFDYGADSLPDFLRRLVDDWELTHALITLGPNGALAMARDVEPVYVPGFKVDAIDATGAGDAFTAGFIHRHLHGYHLPDCVTFGCALGALTATKPGGTGIVTREEIEALIANPGERAVDETLGRTPAAA